MSNALTFTFSFLTELNCRVPSDIVFVLDGSESLKDDDFKSMKKFVNNLLLGYPVEENYTRIGVIVFGTYPADTIELTSTYNKYLLAARIENLAHPKSGTGTARALESMREMFRTKSTRDFVHRVGVVITDGRSARPDQTKNQAAMARAEGITLLAIGFGSSIFRTELETIATASNVFSVANSFNDSLERVDAALRPLVCEAPPVIVLSGGSTVLLGGSIILTATISTSSNITSMKWQKVTGSGVVTDIDIASSSGKYSGSTVSSLNPRLVINNANYNDGAIYRLVVTNTGGETTSNLIEIRVVELPSITISGSSIVGYGSTATLSAVISATVQILSVRWQKVFSNGAAYDIDVIGTSGKYTGSTNSITNPVLVINGVDSTDEANYQLVVTTALGEVSSNQINLIITGGPTSPITTTKALPFTTDRINSIAPELCPNCIIGRNWGYKSVAGDCTKFIYMLPDADGKALEFMHVCPWGQFWNLNHLTCQPAHEVYCPDSPCIGKIAGTIAMADHCSAFWVCLNGTAVASCCPSGNNAYVQGVGCTTDPTCLSDCPPKDNRIVAPVVCTNFPDVTDEQKFIQMAPSGNISMRCPLGTAFVAADCGCTRMVTILPSSNLNECKPEVIMTFDDPSRPFADSSTNGITVTYEYVDIDPALRMAKFNGSGMINLYRFAFVDFQESLVIRLEFQELPGGAEQQALVTNCIFSYQEEATISMIVDKKISAVIFGLETSDAKAEFIVPYTKNVMNKVIFIYNGENAVAVINNVRANVRLTGHIIKRQSGIVIGAGSQLGHFTGYVDNFELFMCLPSEIDQYLKD
ncbi:uncharacterized protein LOC134236858 [Saccostrea cucullata]|uniref:uncharacterized protein LOC134236858 n=1 Tax=Saccostrea cuccullata TaxID=36930 RepID=UPI002ED2885E